ncbi:uncharacterized, partial [Tachysurus ichikawai]
FHVVVVPVVAGGCGAHAGSLLPQARSAGQYTHSNLRVESLPPSFPTIAYYLQESLGLPKERGGKEEDEEEENVPFLSVMLMRGSTNLTLKRAI